MLSIPRSSQIAGTADRAVKPFVVTVANLPVHTEQNHVKLEARRRELGTQLDPYHIPTPVGRESYPFARPRLAGRLSAR